MPINLYGKKLLLRMHEASTGGEGGNNSTGAGTEGAGDNGGEGTQTPPTPAPAPVPPVDPTPSLLKDLGYDSADDLKTALGELKTLQDGQKTEQEKLNENLTKAQSDLEKAQQSNVDLTNQLAAANAGVPGDKVNDVLALANNAEGDDINAKIKSVLEKYPDMTTAQSTETKPQIQGAGKDPKNSGQPDTLKDSFLAAWGKKQ